MANITQDIANIRNATYGKEVRESIASGIEDINAEVVSTTAKQTVLEGKWNSELDLKMKDNIDIFRKTLNNGDIPETKDYTNISVKADGTTAVFDDWLTSGFKKCNGYKYLKCTDVAYFYASNANINAISFYDVNSNYIYGIGYFDIKGYIDTDSCRHFSGYVEIPYNAYYFRDTKHTSLTLPETRNEIYLKNVKEDIFEVNADNTDYTNTSVKADGTTVTYDGWYTSDYKKCNNHKYLKCESVACYGYNGVNINGISFYNENKEYISGIGTSDVEGYTDSQSGTIFSGIFKIPSNAYYFRDTKYSISKNIISLVDDSNDIINSVIDLVGKGIELEGSYTNTSVKADGTIATFDNWYTSDYKECHNFKYLNCKDVAYYNYGGTAINGISFYDIDKNYISGYSEGTLDIDGRGHINGYVEIPSNAYYFRDCKYNNGSIITKNEIYLKNINKNISDIVTNTNPFSNLKILCIGDSLTEGDYGSDPEGVGHIHSENYPYYLQKYLGCTVTNKGKCGLKASNYYSSIIKSIDFTVGYDVIIIMLGTNGAMTDTVDADTTITEGQTYEDYADTETGNYCKIVEYCYEKAHNAQIILCTPPHVGIKRQIYRNNAIACNIPVKKVGEKYNIPVIDVMHESGFNDINQDVFQPVDNLHFGKLGYKKLATFIGSKVKSLLSYVIED